MRRGAHGDWFHDVWTCGAKVLEYWMISSMKIKLNRSWKFRRNWNVPLVLLERSWWAGLNEIYLVRFGFRMWEILISKWFLLLKIQINSKNQVKLKVVGITWIRASPPKLSMWPGTGSLGWGSSAKSSESTWRLLGPWKMTTACSSMT